MGEGLSWWPHQRSSSQNVHVQVVHRLSSSGSIVNHQTITSFIQSSICSHILGGLHELAEDLCLIRRGSAQGRNVCSWDHQNVHWSLRVNVIEGNTEFVLQERGKAASKDGVSELLVHMPSKFAKSSRTSYTMSAGILPAKILPVRGPKGRGESGCLVGWVEGGFA